jgi:hypothetical protein
LRDEPGENEELSDRLDALREAAKALIEALKPELADRDALQQTLRWGIAPEVLDDTLAPAEFRLGDAEKLALQLEQAQEALQARLERTQAVTKEAPAHQVARAIQELSGSGMPIYGCTTLTALQRFGDLLPNPDLNRSWLEIVAAVRPALARVEAHQLQPETPLHVWSYPVDPWTFDPSPEGIQQPQNLAVCYTPEAGLDENLAVVVLDSWSEMIPDKRHIVEAAFGFNSPGSRAPQAILLAVTPDENQPLDTEILAKIVLEARESAHARMLTPDDLGAFAALFPFGMVPAERPTGVSMRPVHPV